MSLSAVRTHTMSFSQNDNSPDSLAALPPLIVIYYNSQETFVKNDAFLLLFFFFFVWMFCLGVSSHARTEFGHLDSDVHNTCLQEVVVKLASIQILCGEQTN
jgi:hypothetical protein